MKITPQQFLSSQFTWKGKCGVSFRSDLVGALRDNVPLGKKLYDDAEDRGFVVHSERTGKAVTFVLDHVTRTDPSETVFKSIDNQFEIRVLNT